MITHLDGASASLLPTIDDVLKTKISVPVADSIVYTWTVQDWNEINDHLESTTFECAGLLFSINLKKRSDTGVGIRLRPPRVLPVDILNVQCGFLMSHPRDPSSKSHIVGSYMLTMTSLDLII